MALVSCGGTVLKNLMGEAAAYCLKQGFGSKAHLKKRRRLKALLGSQTFGGQQCRGAAAHISAGMMQQ